MARTRNRKEVFGEKLKKDGRDFEVQGI